jgi:hypothetical protein
MSEPRHLDGTGRARVRLLARHPAAHRVPRARALAKGPQVRVLDLAEEFDPDCELEGLLAAASQARHPAGRPSTPDR